MKEIEQTIFRVWYAQKYSLEEKKDGYIFWPQVWNHISPLHNVLQGMIRSALRESDRQSFPVAFESKERTWLLAAC